MNASDGTTRSQERWYSSYWKPFIIVFGVGFPLLGGLLAVAFFKQVRAMKRSEQIAALKSAAKVWIPCISQFKNLCLMGGRT